MEGTRRHDSSAPPSGGRDWTTLARPTSLLAAKPRLAVALVTAWRLSSCMSLLSHMVARFLQKEMGSLPVAITSWKLSGVISGTLFSFTTSRSTCKGAKKGKGQRVKGQGEFKECQSE